MVAEAGYKMRGGVYDGSSCGGRRGGGFYGVEDIGGVGDEAARWRR